MLLRAVLTTGRRRLGPTGDAYPIFSQRYRLNQTDSVSPAISDMTAPIIRVENSSEVVEVTMLLKKVARKMVIAIVP